MSEGAEGDMAHAKADHITAVQMGDDVAVSFLQVNYQSIAINHARVLAAQTEIAPAPVRASTLVVGRVVMSTAAFDRFLMAALQLRAEHGGPTVVDNG